MQPGLECIFLPRKAAPPRPLPSLLLDRSPAETGRDSTASASDSSLRAGPGFHWIQEPAPPPDTVLHSGREKRPPSLWLDDARSLRTPGEGRCRRGCDFSSLYSWQVGETISLGTEGDAAGSPWGRQVGGGLCEPRPGTGEGAIGEWRSCPGGEPQRLWAGGAWLAPVPRGSCAQRRPTPNPCRLRLLRPLAEGDSGCT